MENINLTEEEIQQIRAFLFKANRINLIQCVYICSYFSKEQNRDIIEVTSVINYSDSLRENKEGTYNDDKYTEGAKYLYNKAKDLITESNNDRLVFTTDTSFNYSIINMSNLNVRASRKLISSTILLDNFNRFSRIKEIVSDEFEPYPEIKPIENVDKILNTSNDKVKKKTIF